MKKNINDIVANTEALHQKAVVILRQKLAQDPNNERTLWKLAEILRQQGKLDEALAGYQKIVNLRPDHKMAQQICTILGQHGISSGSSEAIQPAPFVHIQDFLSDDAQQQIWQQITRHQDKFSPSKISKNTLDLSLRKSHVLYKNQLQEIAPWFMDKVVERLAGVWQQLAIRPFTPVYKEIQLTMHLDGGLFKVHKDSWDSPKDEMNRVITYLYYFHHLPKGFRGGELLLFDTNLEQDGPTLNYTRITPTNNSLLFFPSQFYHLVTPVRCEEDKIENGRFTINGWLHNWSANLPEKKNGDQRKVITHD